MTKTKNRRVARNFLGQGIFVWLIIHQIFHLLNKTVQKKFEEIFLSIESITLKSFIQKNRFINTASEHCFEVTLADFEQIINNDFIQLETE